MSNSPRLTLAHATLAVSKFDDTLAFYRDVLGFHVTNQGEVPGGNRMSFISQDPDNQRSFAHKLCLMERASVRGRPMAANRPYHVARIKNKMTANAPNKNSKLANSVKTGSYITASVRTISSFAGINDDRPRIAAPNR